jgi:t-SNARE complex subunit (syntaxin)
MAKTKLEKIANIEEEINQLNARKKQLLQQHNEQGGG